MYTTITLLSLLIPTQVQATPTFTFFKLYDRVEQVGANYECRNRTNPTSFFFVLVDSYPVMQTRRGMLTRFKRGQLRDEPVSATDVKVFITAGGLSWTVVAENYVIAPFAIGERYRIDVSSSAGSMFTTGTITEEGFRSYRGRSD